MKAYTTARILALVTATATMVSLAACGSSADTSTTGAAEPLAKVAAPAGRSWSQVASATDDGFMLGNPDAPIKLVEFGSFTCGHCAEYSVTSHEAIKTEFIDSGRVSFEMRPFIRDPLDLSLAVVASCAGADRFFPLAENIFASHTSIMEGAQAASQANQAEMANVQALPEADRLPTLAGFFGVPQFFAARGIPAAESNRCLRDGAAITKRTEVTERNARQYEISGTPTFLLNGNVMQDAGTWEQVRDQLRSAGAR
ncbi:MAG: thioredoxin domain-containing protein [Sphingopyxis sp.]